MEEGPHGKERCRAVVVCVVLPSVSLHFSVSHLRLCMPRANCGLLRPSDNETGGLSKAGGNVPGDSALLPASMAPSGARELASQCWAVRVITALLPFVLCVQVHVAARSNHVRFVSFIHMFMCIFVRVLELGNGSCNDRMCGVVLYSTVDVSKLTNAEKNLLVWEQAERPDYHVGIEDLLDIARKPEGQDASTVLASAQFLQQVLPPMLVPSQDDAALTYT